MSYKFNVNTTNTFTPNHFNVHGGQSTQCLYKLVKKYHLFIKKSRITYTYEWVSLMELNFKMKKE